MRGFALLALFVLLSGNVAPCCGENTSCPDSSDYKSHPQWSSDTGIDAVASALPPAVTGLSRLSTDSAEFLHSAGTIWLDDGPESTTITLHSGKTLIGAVRPTCVKVNQCALILNKGAVALLSKRDDLVLVRLLYEAGAGSAYLVVGTKPIQLLPGAEIGLANSATSIAGEISADSIARRRTQLYALSSGGFIHFCEFYPASVMGRDQLLRAILHSDQKSDRVLAGKLRKMAACLSVVTASHGQFKYYSNR